MDNYVRQFFKNLSDKRKKNVLKGEWLLCEWHKLATNAGFSESFFRKQYMYLCSFAHSNRLSVIQIQQSKTEGEQRQNALSFIGVITVVLAKFTYDYVKIMLSVNEKINLDTEEYKLILQFKEIAGLLD
jgi:hypothetical protein